MQSPWFAKLQRRSLHWQKWIAFHSQNQDLHRLEVQLRTQNAYQTSTESEMLCYTRVQQVHAALNTYMRVPVRLYTSWSGLTRYFLYKRKWQKNGDNCLLVYHTAAITTDTSSIVSHLCILHATLERFAHARARTTHVVPPKPCPRTYRAGCVLQCTKTQTVCITMYACTVDKKNET